jgi:hypothetical protein
MSTSHDDLIEHSVNIHWPDGYDPGQPLTQSEKLGAHSRHDAVQRARAIGLLAVSARTS